MKKLFKQKIIALAILASFSFNILTPAVAHAQFTDVMQHLKEYGLDGVMYSLAQLAGTKLSNKILNKANGGASGDSSQQSLISNFSDYFSDLNNQQVDKFVTDLGISKNPYASDIAKSLIQSTQNIAKGQDPLSAFNLDKVVGTNWKEFANDASVGGWDGILALSNPANTTIGARILAQEDLARKIEDAKELEKIKLTTPGTRPQGKCTMDFKKYKNNINNIKNNRESINDLNAATSAPVSVPTPDQIAEEEDSGETDFNPEDIKSGLQADNINTGIALGEEYGACLEEMINNPIAFVNTTISGALDQAKESLKGTDELTEFIGNMLISLMGSFLQNGLSSLAADFNQSRAPIGGPEQLVSTNGQSIPWTQAPTTVVDLEADLQNSIDMTKKEISLNDQYMKKIRETDPQSGSYVAVLSQLDQCLPGPDYGYQKRLDAYFSKATKRYRKRSEKGNDDKQTRKKNGLENLDSSIEEARQYMDIAINDPGRNIPGSEAMVAQLQNIKKIHDQYQSVRENRSSKQTALGLLGTAQSSLNPSIQLLAPLFDIRQVVPAGANTSGTTTSPVPELPSFVPFVRSDWESLSAAKKSALITWAKQLQKIPTDIPITSDGWNTLSATKKTSAVAWATDLFGKKPANTTDKDFVLSAIRSLMNITPDIATKLARGTDEVSEETIHRDFVIRTVWSVWTYPENYITSWDASSDVAKQFLEMKNKARAVYSSVQNDLAIAYSVSEAQKNLDQITFAVDGAKKLLHDCNLLKIIVQNNDALKTDPERHDKLKTILISRLGQFQSDDVRTDIQGGGSILARPAFNTYADYGSTYQLPCRLGETPPSGNTALSAGTTLEFCYLDIDLVPGNYGIDDSVEPMMEPIRKVYNKLQVQPALDIWDLFTQASQSNAFCGFTYFMKEYGGDENFTPNPILDGGKPILCGTNNIAPGGIVIPDTWYGGDATTIRNIIYKTDE